MRTERIQMRVFIEGVFVPHISSATVNTFANEEARASIIMPSVPKFQTEELKRALVHIYWSDIEIRSERERDDWPLLFEGEITADSFSKMAAGQRNQIFHCSGFHTYWEQVLLYYYEIGQGPYHKAVWSQNVSVALGNSQFEFDGNVAGGNLRQRLVGEVQKNKDEPYPSMVKRVFGEVLDVNHFFRESNQRLKLNHRFISANDPNLDVLVGQSLLAESLSQDKMAMSGQTSMMATLKAVLDVFRYQIVNNSQPAFLSEERQGKKTAENKITDVAGALDLLESSLFKFGVSETLTKFVVSKMEESTTDDEIVDLVDKVLKETGRSEDEAARTGMVEELKTTRDYIQIANDPENKVKAAGLQKEEGDLLTQYMLLPDTRFSLPPTCNVIFPQDQTHMGMDRNLLQEPTRAIGLPQQVQGLSFGLYLAPPELSDAVVPVSTVVPVTKSGFFPPIIAPHRISSGWGPRQIKQHTKINGKTVWVPHPHASKYHQGIDIARPNIRVDFTGTAIYAFDAGTVVRSRVPNNLKRGYGIVVYINHHNGMQTRYGHMDDRAVFEGQEVSRGQLIGHVGSTGVSTGAHLHFEVRIHGKPVDPAKLLKTAKTDDLSTTTQEPVLASTPEEKITDMASRKDSLFLDYQYLTPEEQKTGIVPFFDQSVIRSYAFMQFTGKESQVHSHYQNMLNSEFLWRRYSTRAMPALSLPFNPYPVAGFPALVVDRLRSIIGLISNISHTISVGGGQGVASTTIQIESPRFWDEGDPYFWLNGKSELATVDSGAFEGRRLPDPDKANFPSYYLQSLVPTNSSDSGDRWHDTSDVVVPPESKQKTRDIDKLYKSLFGGSVRGIPYQYSTRRVEVRNTNVAYNKAIDGPDSDIDYRNTVVGYYYHLVKTNSELAEAYVKSITRRHGVSERTLMTVVIGATTSDGGQSYQGGAFRSSYQELVGKMNGILGDRPAHRG